MVDSAKMAIYLYPGKILADHLSIKSHLRDAHGATADYDDTALGTLTVHPWRAGPDCGKLYYYIILHRIKVRWRFRKILWPSQII